MAPSLPHVIFYAQLEGHGRTDAPIGRATAKPRLVNRDEPGGKVTIGSTTADAYAQIGFLVVAAGLLTWMGVPAISHLALVATSSDA